MLGKYPVASKGMGWQQDCTKTVAKLCTTGQSASASSYDGHFLCFFLSPSVISLEQSVHQVSTAPLAHLDLLRVSQYSTQDLHFEPASSASSKMDLVHPILESA